MVDLSMAPEAVESLRSAGDLDHREPDQDVLKEIIGDYDALWSHIDLQVSREVLDRAGRLRVINTASTGTNHIDKEAAAEKDIRILSITRDDALLDTFTATAECAWMLMLACHRHLRGAVNHVLEGGWELGAYTGQQLSEKTLGVLGVGRLGKMTVEYGKAFRMRVLGCDHVPFDIDGVERVDFETMIAESDAISLHIHLLPENVGLFNEQVFAKMKDGAILINTSRGDVIEEQALLAALENGKLGGFGADVIHDEWRADMRESPVVQYAADHENVVITPHMGGATDKSIRDARVFSAQKLAHYLTTGDELRMP